MRSERRSRNRIFSKLSPEKIWKIRDQWSKNFWEYLTVSKHGKSKSLFSIYQAKSQVLSIQLVKISLEFVSIVPVSSKDKTMFTIWFYLCLAQNMSEKINVISLVQIIFSHINLFPFELSGCLEGTTHTILSYMSLGVAFRCKSHLGGRWCSCNLA